MNAQVFKVMDALDLQAPQLAYLSLAMVNRHGRDPVDEKVMRHWYKRTENAEHEIRGAQSLCSWFTATMAVYC